MIGYKIAYAETSNQQDKPIRVLITLEIPQDARTNCKRRFLAYPSRAKYRCNKAMVLQIEDTQGNTYEEATSCFYTHKQLTYVVGDMVYEENYNELDEVVCGAGIHFFLNKDVALSYESNPLELNQEGVFESWYDNGQCMILFEYKHGKRDGICQRWYENGRIMEECWFKLGKKHGVYKFWWPNLQIMIECVYFEGRKVGLYQEWAKNGHLEKHVLYSSPWTDADTNVNVNNVNIETQPSVQNVSFIQKWFCCF